MDYLNVPNQISAQAIRAKGFSLSPGMYRRIEIPNNNSKLVRNLLDPSRPYDKGTEPGSFFYLSHSTHGFIRTKALQEHSTLLNLKGESIVPLNPRGVEDWEVFDLQDGDLLMAKDSNVGECVMVDGDSWKNHAWSNGIVRLHPVGDRYYFFAFIKHPVFKAQLLSMLPRGATILHAKDLWLNCSIPFPNQPNASRVEQYVSVLMQSIIDKERAIRAKGRAIQQMLHTELLQNANGGAFQFEHPNSHEVRSKGRLDAAIYSYNYRKHIALVQRYKYGWQTPEQAGFTITPGPSLEIKLLRIRLDSDFPRPNFYSLILPTNISEYGTLNKIEYMGTPKQLPLLKKGDIIFGEAGYQKGRSLVLLNDIEQERYTTNAHGLYARRRDNELHKSVFFRCIFNWYRSMGIIDLMAVGGNGGHFSPEYFPNLAIPKFPDEAQAKITRLYHNPSPMPSTQTLTLDTFVSWHRMWNQMLGVWELDQEMKSLQTTLRKVQDDIILGKIIQIPFI